MNILKEQEKELLRLILEEYNKNNEEQITGNYDEFPEYMRFCVKDNMENLKRYGYISFYRLYLNEWTVILSPEGKTYFESEQKYIEESEKMYKPSFNIGTVNNTGNLVFGDSTNSTFNIDNSIDIIEKRIEELGGTDKEELTEILQEIKEYSNNVQDSKNVFKNNNLFEKVTKHCNKYQWFYSDIVSFLGKLVLNNME